MSGLIGVPELRSRLQAVGNTRDLARLLALTVLAEQKRTIPRATGASGRSLHIEHLTSRGADIVATGGAVFQEEGTRPHTILPRTAKVLRFAVGAEGRRLSGRPRSGARVVFAKRVRHPGTKGVHWAARGITTAARTIQMAGAVIKRWNDAA